MVFSAWRFPYQCYLCICGHSSCAVFFLQASRHAFLLANIPSHEGWTFLQSTITRVPSPREGFGGLNSPRNWNMKHYKSAEFLSNFRNVKPSCTNVFFLRVSSGSNKIHKVFKPCSVVDVRGPQVFQDVRRTLQSKIIWLADCCSAPQMHLGVYSMPQRYRLVLKAADASS